MHPVNKIVTEYYKDSNNEKEQCINKLKDIFRKLSELPTNGLSIERQTVL